MLLAIDIGNTNTVLGAFDGEKLVDSWRVKTDSRTTADEMALQWRGLLGDIDVDGISVCSTVPAVLHEVRGLLGRYYADVSSIIVEPGRVRFSFASKQAWRATSRRRSAFRRLHSSNMSP